MMKKLFGPLMAVLAVLLTLRFYLVRELLAAELLFGLALAALFMFGILTYLVGSVCERGLQFAQVGVRRMVDRKRGGFSLEKSVEKSFSA